jgi:N-glycosidase YbiA
MTTGIDGHETTVGDFEMRAKVPNAIDPIPSELAIPDDNRVLYFERDRAAFRFLSHFFPAPIHMDGETWATVEHYYQAQKSHDPTYRQAIRDTLSPGMAKRLAAPPQAPRRVSGQSWFRKNGTLPRPDWHDVKLGIMRRADMAKFTQHSKLGDLLLATGDAELVEDSSYEPYWGIGPDGQGLNWAGRIIMEVREQLRASR